MAISSGVSSQNEGMRAKGWLDVRPPLGLVSILDPVRLISSHAADEPMSPFLMQEDGDAYPRPFIRRLFIWACGGAHWPHRSSLTRLGVAGRGAAAQFPILAPWRSGLVVIKSD